MKSYKYFFLLPLLTLAACEKPMDESFSQNTDIADAPVFYAEMPQLVSDASTKTLLTDENKIVWDLGDRITVFPKLSARHYYTLKTGSENTSGEFVYESKYEPSSTYAIPVYVGASPQSTNYDLSYDKEKDLISVTNWKVDAAPTYQKDLLPYSLPMLAVSTDNNLLFKHLSSVLKLQFTVSPAAQQVKHLKVYSKNSSIAGYFTVRFKPDGTITELGTPTSSTIMIRNLGKELSETPKSVYIPIASQETGETIHIQMVGDNGLSQYVQFTTSEKNKLEAGNILSMPALAFNPTVKPVLSFEESASDVLAQSGIINVFYTIKDDNFFQASATADVPWINEMETGKQNDKHFLKFVFDANDTDKPRTGHVTLKTTGAEDIVYTLTQAASETLQDPTGRLRSVLMDTTAIRVDMPATKFAGATFETLLNLSLYKANSEALSTIIGQEDQFMLRIGDSGVENGRIQVAVGNVGNNGEQSVGGKLTSVTSLQLNKWYHVAATIEEKGTGIIAKLYINGNLESEKEFPNIKMPELGGDGVYSKPNSTYNYGAKKMITIGRMPGFQWGERWMAGMLAETRVWGVARTGEQIKASMFTVDPTTPGLEAYYKFDGTDVDAEGKFVTDAADKHRGVVTGKISAKDHETIVLD